MTGSPRAAAQRRLPSMMIATCRGRSRIGSASDLHHVGFFALGALLDRVDVPVGEALQALQLAPLLVLREAPLAQLALEVICHLAAVVADLDARLLRPLAHLLDHLAA